ncbi:MAG TPA: hypothetical protein VF876_04705 [Burkholderiales bacterium]
MTVLLLSAGLATPAAYASTQESSASSVTVPALSFPSPLARKGTDDPIEIDDGCDDHGTDVYNAAPVTLAKNGTDDPVETDDGCDDHGTDVCNAVPVTVAKHGADDYDDGFDDEGVDPVQG